MVVLIQIRSIEAFFFLYNMDSSKLEGTVQSSGNLVVTKEKKQQHRLERAGLALLRTDTMERTAQIICSIHHVISLTLLLAIESSLIAATSIAPCIVINQPLLQWLLVLIPI